MPLNLILIKLLNLFSLHAETCNHSDIFNFSVIVLFCNLVQPCKVFCYMQCFAALLWTLERKKKNN